jgi:hypothetical protein
MLGPPQIEPGSILLLLIVGSVLNTGLSAFLIAIRDGYAFRISPLKERRQLSGNNLLAKGAYSTNRLHAIEISYSFTIDLYRSRHTRGFGLPVKSRA